MLISFAWLAELVPMIPDAAELGRRLTARGLTVDAVTRVSGDTVFAIDVPANRRQAAFPGEREDQGLHPHFLLRRSESFGDL